MTGAIVKLLLTISVVAALSSPCTDAYTIYRCKTDRGVIFSENHCGDGAVRLSASNPERPRAEPVVARKPTLPRSNAQAFERLSSAATEQILRETGEPAARYIDAGVEHWLYPGVTRNVNGQIRSPDIHVLNGRSYQIAWLLQPVMEKTVVLAAEISEWTADGPVKDKDFSLDDIDVAGKSKDDVVRVLGEPDAKTIANGRERWEYRLVKLSPEGNRRVTLLLEFEGDNVAGFGGI